MNNKQIKKNYILNRYLIKKIFIFIKKYKYKLDSLSKEPTYKM